MMRRCKWLAVALLVGSTMAAKAEGLPYLSDILDKPTYRAAFNKMLKGQKVEDWVATFVKTKNGVASPGEAKPIGGASYEEYDVCEPHNCGGNFLFVIFTAGGGRAWGLFIKDGRTVRYYGNPTGAVRQALDKAAALQR